MILVRRLGDIINNSIASDGNYIEFNDYNNLYGQNFYLSNQEIVKYADLESEFYSTTYIRQWCSRLLPAYALDINGIIVDPTIINKSKNIIFVRDSYDQFIIMNGSLFSHPLSYNSNNDRNYKRKLYGKYHNSWCIGDKMVKAISLDRIKYISSDTNEETFVLSWHQDQKNYWHFLFETSFRLFALQQIKGRDNMENVNFIVIGQDLNRYQKELFTALLKQKLVYNIYPNGCTIKNCWMVPAINSLLNYQLLNKYSKTISDGLNQVYTSIPRNNSQYISIVNIKSKRIYILRGKNRNGRNIINEKDLLMLIKKYEFTTVDPGSITVAEQAEIFGDVDIVLGAHGSAFANILFMNKGLIIELVSGSYDPIHDYFLAKAKNIRFLRVRSEVNTSITRPEHKDFECDLSKVNRALSIYC